ncbi:acyltransferase family protein [Arthrobacter sp. Ld5]|uniref:acyltransferase family protein n=1 Tax=Arthrobacter sp. Ld5 TaxID=649152 RepID=UPI003EBADCFC
MATLYAPTPATAASTPTRSGAIDALRVLAVVGIVAGHVWSGPLVDAGLYTWHVPAFFLLSGYLWKTRKPGARWAVATEAGKRFRTIMVPYVAWLVLTLAVHLVVLSHRGQLEREAVTLPLIGGSENAGPFGAYWFMPALFFSAVVFRALELVPLALRTAIIMGITAAIYRFGDVLAPLPLSVGVAGAALVFMLAGQGLRHVRAKVEQPIRVGLACLIAGATPILTGVSAHLDIKYGELGAPVLSIVVAVLISCGLLLVLEGVFTRLPGQVHAVSTTLAAGCLMVVLTHTYILWLLAIPTAERPLWVLVVAVAVPWTIALVLHRTPLSRTFLGMPRAA